MTDESKTSSENPAGLVSSSDSEPQKLGAKLSQRSGGVARRSIEAVPRRERLGYHAVPFS